MKLRSEYGGRPRLEIASSRRGGGLSVLLDASCALTWGVSRHVDQRGIHYANCNWQAAVLAPHRLRGFRFPRIGRTDYALREDASC
jgi:hypothetical protein